MSQMAAFQERIVSTVDGSVTSVQAIYVPSDDVTDPGVQAILPYMQSMVILSRAVAERGIYPAMDVFESTSSILTPDVVGKEHYDTVLAAQLLLNKYTELSHMVAIIGEAELSAEQRLQYNRAKKLINYMSQPFFVAEAQTGRPGYYVERQQTVKDVQAIMRGDVDDIPESDFMNIGAISTIEEVKSGKKPEEHKPAAEILNQVQDDSHSGAKAIESQNQQSTVSSPQSAGGPPPVITESTKPLDVQLAQGTGQEVEGGRSEVENASHSGAKAIESQPPTSNLRTSEGEPQDPFYKPSIPASGEEETVVVSMAGDTVVGSRNANGEFVENDDEGASNPQPPKDWEKEINAILPEESKS